MMSRLFFVTVLAITLTACGGSGGGGGGGSTGTASGGTATAGGGATAGVPTAGNGASDPAASLQEVTEQHANGQTAARGMVDDQGRKQGWWVTWWDNGRPKWEGSYVDDVQDPNQYWCSWNEDGSFDKDWQRP